MHRLMIIFRVLIVLGFSDMPFTCKGICEGLKNHEKGMYGRGSTWCSVCACQYEVTVINCFCCGALVRYRPKNVKAHKKIPVARH